MKLPKCVFAQRQWKYLGHVVSAAGVAIDAEKVRAVQSWHNPQSVKELRSFLGLAGYYCRFIFGIIAKPLLELLKRGVPFVWTQCQEASFVALKEALTPAPMLALPEFSKLFTFETDASGGGIGAVLMQGGHSLAFLSRTLGPCSQGLSTYEKEYMTILMALEQWRAYLQYA